MAHMTSPCAHTTKQQNLLFEASRQGVETVNPPVTRSLVELLPIGTGLIAPPTGQNRASRGPCDPRYNGQLVEPHNDKRRKSLPSIVQFTGHALCRPVNWTHDDNRRRQPARPPAR